MSFSLFAAATLSAQMTIGKEAVSNKAVSLEFGAGNKGIILPYVSGAAAMQNVAAGTIVMDASTGVVQYSKGAGVWQPLSQSGQASVNGVSATVTGAADTTLQQNLADLPGVRAVIGSTQDHTPGILVLSDPNKAMILPKMDSPHLNIISPAAGMIAYDTKTKQLAVYNGTVWTFWSAAQY